MKELQAVNQQVILDVNDDKAEQKTKAGIIIPDSAKEKNNIAKVINMSKIDNSELLVNIRCLLLEIQLFIKVFQVMKLLSKKINILFFLMRIF